MDAKELLKKELREALMDPELYKKFRVARNHPVQKSCSQSSRGIMQGNSGVRKTIKCMGTKADAAEDTDEQDFAMQQKHSSRATATTIIPAIDREIGPLLLKPKPTTPLTRKIQIMPIESVHKSCKNPNFVFRPISPAGQPQEAQGASPEGGLLTFKDLMDQNEHKAYETENRVTAGNCNIYKQILAAAKENRKSLLKMSTRGDVEHPCNLDKSNVPHSLQKSTPNYSEEKLRKVWMHIANSNLDETPLDTQMEDIEQQSKTIGMLPSLSTGGKFDADQFASVSKEAFVHDLVQPSAVLSGCSNIVSDAVPHNDSDDVTEDKELLSSISAEDKFDADQFASVSKEASALDLVQPSAVLSEYSNTVSDPIPNNHGDDITEDKQLLSSISAEDKIDADQFASVSKEASALDLEQPSAVLSEYNNTVSDAVPNSYGDDITEDKQLLSSISAEDEIDADQFASVSKEASAPDLVQPSAVLSEYSNTVSDPIPNNHGDDITEDKQLLSSISAEDKIDADQFASVSKEASAHDLVQPSAILRESSNTVSDAVPNSHGDDVTEDKEILTGIPPEDKCDAGYCASVSKEASAHDLVQPSAVLSECSNTVSDAVPNNHGDDVTADKELLSSISAEDSFDADQCASVSKEASAHDLVQPSAVLSESTVSDIIPNNHGDDNTTPEQEIPCDSSRATGTTCNTDKCLDVPVETSAHKLYQSSTILSKVFPNNHGDSTKQDQEIPSCLNTVDTCDAVRYVDVPSQASANHVDQSQTVVRESAEATHDDIHNHSHNTKQDQDIPSGHPTLAKQGAAYAHDLGRPSAVVGETSVIFDDTPNMYSNACSDNEAMKSDQAKSVQCESIADVVGSSGYNQSSGLIKNPFKLRNEDGDENISSNISEDSSSGEDDMLNEVYQSCLAKGMRPKYLSSNYLKGLANARKTAAEIKARKPEPRVKLHKPCRLDTNLTYAVRQSLKRSLPLIAGKNKLSALMMMADGMFDEMSLDRDLDDLAWPFDPLAELRESGLWMVDYMDPHPTGSTKSRVKLQSTAMLSESNKTNVDDIQNNQGDAVSQEEEIPSDDSQETVTTHDPGRSVDVSSESSAHKLDQCTGMLSGSNKTIFDDIQNNNGDARYQEQEIPSDNSQETLSAYDSARCVDVSSESSAHKLDQCTDMLSESNKTIFDDIQNNHGDATYQEQEIPSDNSQGTLATYDLERCVDVSPESSAHKLDQCTDMLSESNKTIFDDIQNNHGDATYQEQEIPSDNSQGTLATYDLERCVDVLSESSAHKLDQCKGMLSESNKTIFEDIQKNQDDNTSDVQELSYNFQGSATNYDSEICVDDQAKAFTHKPDYSSVVVSERDITIFNADRDIRQDKEIVSSLGTILEVSEDGCIGVPKEVFVHKQNHVPADFGEKGTSTSSYFDVTPENQEIPPGQPIVANNDEGNSAYVKEAASASEMSQSSDNVNNPVMQRSKKNRNVSPSIFENGIDDDDKDMLNEVYQSCLAKEMRPKYLSKNYLKGLASARKTAAEIKARKPEPRVKLDKPCRLDTNLMYAVRQSLKRSLPLIAGKNKLSALMMMADGMFDEMSLDRGLDDLAWPFDPLAELRESGLAMVDYMDPHPTGSTTMNTSDRKDQSSPPEFVVPSASTQDENDHNSSDSVVKILDNIVKTKSPVPTNEQRSITDEDINSTEFHTEVSRPTGQPVATTATDDLSSPQGNSSEISLGTTVFREDLPEKLTENDSDTGHNFEMHESSQPDNLMHNDDTSTWTLKREPVDLGQISTIDFQPPTSHSSDILQTTSVDSDLQSEDSALGQDNYSTSVDDACSTSDFSSDIEEVDPSSQNLRQKIQFFSNAASTLFSKPSSISHVNLKVSVPSKVHHFEKLAQEERSSKPQKFLAKDNRLISHNRLSSAGDAKIKIEKFERMRVPTIPTVNIQHETLNSSIKEDTSASKVNVMKRVEMFELSDGLTAFNKQPISAAKPKITGRLNKSKIAFFEHLANSNI